MQLEVKNIEGKVVKKVDVSDSVFDVPMNEGVLHTVVKAHLANQRQGTHATKTRSYVSGGGKKPFKQKGTGEARQGTTRSPLNPGGATLHGPQPRDYRQTVNQKVRDLALRIALSDKARNGQLIVVDDFKATKFSTKQVTKILSAFSIKKALVADEQNNEFLYRSARNIHGVASVTAKDVNVHALLKHESLLISERGLLAIQARCEEG